jgi:hypothetical protein
MMPSLAGFVRNGLSRSYPDGDNPVNVTMGKHGEMLVSRLGPEFYNLSLRSKLFIGNQLPAGAAPALWSATTQQCGLLNPLGSGVNLVLMDLNGTYVSGTGIINGLCLAYVPNCGSGVATGSAGVTVATTITPICANLSGAVAAGVFMSAAITTAAPTRLWNLGLNTEVGAVSAATERSLIYNINGKIIVPPGYAIMVGANITGITSVYSFGLMWAELPV